MTEADEIMLAVFLIVIFMIIMLGPSVGGRLYPEVKKEPPGPSSEEMHLKRMRANNPMTEQTVKLPKARVVRRP